MASLTMIPPVCGSNCPPNSSSAASCLNFPLGNYIKQWPPVELFVARELTCSLISPFGSFTICLLLYYTAALLYQQSVVTVEFIVSSLKCCLGLLLGVLVWF